jgi:hypothetical protein
VGNHRAVVKGPAGGFGSYLSSLRAPR